MALTGTPFATGFSYQFTEETVLGIAGVDNVRYGPTTLFAIDANIAAAAAEVQLKLYDHTNPIYGTTIPIIGYPVGTINTDVMIVPGGLPFTAGASMCACEELGTTVTNPPDFATRVRLLTNS